MKEISYSKDVSNAPKCDTWSHKTKQAPALFQIKATLRGEFTRRYCADCAIDFIQNVVKDMKEHGEL